MGKRRKENDTRLRSVFGELPTWRRPDETIVGHDVALDVTEELQLTGRLQLGRPRGQRKSAHSTVVVDSQKLASAPAHERGVEVHIQERRNRIARMGGAVVPRTLDGL